MSKRSPTIRRQGRDAYGAGRPGIGAGAGPRTARPQITTAFFWQTTGNRGTAKLGDYGIESAAREDRCYVSPAAGEFWQSVRKNGHAKSGSYVACKEDYRAPCQTARGRLLPLQYARPAAGYFASDANYAKKGRIL